MDDNMIFAANIFEPPCSNCGYVFNVENPKLDHDECKNCPFRIERKNEHDSNML